MLLLPILLHSIALELDILMTTQRIFLNTHICFVIYVEKKKNIVYYYVFEWSSNSCSLYMECTLEIDLSVVHYDTYIVLWPEMRNVLVNVAFWFEKMFILFRLQQSNTTNLFLFNFSAVYIKRITRQRLHGKTFLFISFKITMLSEFQTIRWIEQREKKNKE